MRGPRHKCFKNVQLIGVMIDNMLTHYFLGIPIEPSITVKSAATVATETVTTQTEPEMKTIEPNIKVESTMQTEPEMKTIDKEPPTLMRYDAFYGLEEFKRFYGLLD